MSDRACEIGHRKTAWKCKLRVERLGTRLRLQLGPAAITFELNFATSCRPLACYLSASILIVSYAHARVAILNFAELLFSPNNARTDHKDFKTSSHTLKSKSPSNSLAQPVQLQTACTEAPGSIPCSCTLRCTLLHSRMTHSLCKTWPRRWLSYLIALWRNHGPWRSIRAHAVASGGESCHLWCQLTEVLPAQATRYAPRV